MRRRLGALLLYLLLAAVLPLPAPGQVVFPTTGTSVPALAPFDDAMTEFMDSRGIEAGLLGVMKDGVVVLERGYGWKDAGHAELLPASAMMRIASVTKPVTAAAIRRLADAGALSLADHVFDLGQPGGGLLALSPFLSLGDSRLADVTVQHCLDHEAGWDRSLVGDLTYMETEIASDMRVADPPGRDNTARWILGQPLQHDPGSVEAYSNVGYLMLGLVVEQVSGMDYMDFVHQEVFASIGVGPGDIDVGRTFAADQNAREPWYQHPGSCVNVFDPSEFVNCPYGGWDHEARVAQGRIIAATRPLLYFLDAFYIAGPSIGAPRTGAESPTWKRNHTGSLSGTNALARQRGDGVNYVVIFNERPGSGTSYASQIRVILDAVIENEIIEWPEAQAVPSISPAGFILLLGLLALAGRSAVDRSRSPRRRARSEHG
ncbi:MAG: serine hydrolase domain-containing protein [Myxococcota bacterium]